MTDEAMSPLRTLHQGSMSHQRTDAVFCFRPADLSDEPLGRRPDTVGFPSFSSSITHNRPPIKHIRKVEYCTSTPQQDVQL
jgi:hypothetical protein